VIFIGGPLSIWVKSAFDRIKRAITVLDIEMHLAASLILPRRQIRDGVPLRTIPLLKGMKNKTDFH